VQAYLFTLPVDEGHFPVLHDTDWIPPVRPRWLYLHDLAVSPASQGLGLSGRLMQQALHCAHTLHTDGLALVAVQGAEAYWTRQGFLAHTPHHPMMQQRLASFGRDALFMMRSL
jgi:predicted N-acetyltransferase YhbS